MVARTFSIAVCSDSKSVTDDLLRIVLEYQQSLVQNCEIIPNITIMVRNPSRELTIQRCGHRLIYNAKTREVN